MNPDSNWREVLAILMQRRIDKYQKAWEEDYHGMIIEDVANRDTTDTQGPQKNRQRELFRKDADA